MSVVSQVSGSLSNIEAQQIHVEVVGEMSGVDDRHGDGAVGVDPAADVDVLQRGILLADFFLRRQWDVFDLLQRCYWHPRE